MKKALATLAAALIGGLALHAQDDAGVRFGLKLSPNSGWIRSDTRGLKSEGNNLGYTFGLISEFPIGASGNYRFATGLNLNYIGGKWSQEYSYQEAPADPPNIQVRSLETSARLGYIELPLTIKMMTNEIGYMRYFGQVGFGTAFNIRAKADIEVPVFYAPPGQAYVQRFDKLEGEDIQDQINLFKASLIVGAGMEYNFSGNTSLLVGITYNNGFVNVLKDVELAEGKKAKAFANYIELTAGVFF